MSVTFMLKTGIPFGTGAEAEMQTEVTLRDLTTGDVIDAQTEAEKLVIHNGEPVLVNSPTQFGYALLRRQIGKIGKISGPISMAQLRQLTSEDMEIINAYVDASDAANAKRVDERGRLAAAGGNA